MLGAYAEKIDGENPSWQLRAREEASAREADLKEMFTLLEIIAKRLNYSIKRQGGGDYLRHQSGNLIYSFSLLLTTVTTPLDLHLLQFTWRKVHRASCQPIQLAHL